MLHRTDVFSFFKYSLGLLGASQRNIQKTTPPNTHETIRGDFYLFAFVNTGFSR